MRALMGRLAATTLIALLIVSSVAPCRQGPVVRERDAPSTADAGMTAPPAPALCVLSAAAVESVAPAFVTARIVATFELLMSGRPTDRTLRPAAVAKPAPAVLRI